MYPLLSYRGQERWAMLSRELGVRLTMSCSLIRRPAALIVLILFLSGPLVSGQPSADTESGILTVDYSDLVDRDALVHDGSTVGMALADRTLRGQVQPFVEPYSNLLSHAIEMVLGRDSLAHQSVAERYPVGSSQPAWVAIFRAGRIHATSDGHNHARMFLPGIEAEAAYREHYPVVRHCLNSVLPTDGSPLTVEVYAYENDYRRQQLTLNLRPYIVRSRSFLSDKTPVDLDQLATFFRRGGWLEGGCLDHEEGLVLYARSGEPPTVDGHLVSLSDLAVAYRAVFHAGDNVAYQSLDAHRDPTMATANFGGFLEDTRLGAVLLKADERFKTIATGLDADDFEDLRDHARRHIGSFLTVSERGLMTTDGQGGTGWVSTRMWFYPDSVQLESDDNYECASIIKAQFLADAERMAEDPDGSHKRQGVENAPVSPSILAGLEHLNHNYSQYAAAFPVFGELSTVARLMGICSWLHRAEADWLDLDDLLSVMLPDKRTIRERQQLLAAAGMTFTANQRLDHDYVARFSETVCLNQVLSSTENVRTRDELKRLVKWAADEIELRTPEEVGKRQEALDAETQAIESMQIEMESIARELEKPDATDNLTRYNELVDEHNRLLDSSNHLIDQYNEHVATLNNVIGGRSVVSRISGGIDVNPKSFSFGRGSREQIRQRLQTTGLIVSSAGGVDGPPESASVAGSDEPPHDLHAERDSSAAGNEPDGAWSVLSSERSPDGSWREVISLGNSRIRERVFHPGSQTLRIEERLPDRLIDRITGRIVGGGHIVFSRPTSVD